MGVGQSCHGRGRDGRDAATATLRTEQDCVVSVLKHPGCVSLLLQAQDSKTQPEHNSHLPCVVATLVPWAQGLGSPRGLLPPCPFLHKD